jgi:ribosomal protein RSM22 (predicted rRNA methylase)
VWNWIFCCCGHENKISVTVDNGKETSSCSFINDTAIL